MSDFLFGIKALQTWRLCTFGRRSRLMSVLISHPPNLYLEYEKSHAYTSVPHFRHKIT